MSGRFVRKSSYRHVHGVQEKPQGCFLNTSVLTSGDGNYVTGNTKFIAYAKRGGGGGPVVVLNRNNPCRLPSSLPMLSVHTRKVLDFHFSPFNDNLLATASEDCHLKISLIPEDGLTSDMKEFKADLRGHEKKVTGVQWHPTANGILASAGFDHTVKIWNSETAQCAFNITHFGDAVQHIAWNRSGSLLGTTCKDKKCRILDPRTDQVAHSVSAFSGSKKSSVVFLSKQELIATVGCTRNSMRQIKLYDPRNMARHVTLVDLDQSAGVMIPHYDHDTNILYVGGKGDSSIKYFEVDKKKLHHLSTYVDNVSQKGFCFLPKLACDTKKCEIASCLRVLRDKIVPVHFCVPRKSGADMFQRDIFPDTAAPVPGATASEYVEGKDGEITLTSMDPEQRQDFEAAEVVVKATYAELEAQLEAANKRIAELEAQLAAQE